MLGLDEQDAFKQNPSRSLKMIFLAFFLFHPGASFSMWAFFSLRFCWFFLSFFFLSSFFVRVGDGGFFVGVLVIISSCSLSGKNDDDDDEVLFFYFFWEPFVTLIKIFSICLKDACIMGL